MILSLTASETRLGPDCSAAGKRCIALSVDFHFWSIGAQLTFDVLVVDPSRPEER